MGTKVSFLNLGTFTELGGSRFAKATSDSDGVNADGDFLVSQRGAGANKSVDIAAGDVFVTNIAGTGIYHGLATATDNETVTSNSSGNPRIDAVSVYFDVSAYGANDNDGALKYKVTAGTAAGSPTAPSDATIQADVGANNPFLRLANVYLPNGYTQIVNANNGTDAYIFDRRIFRSDLHVVRRTYRTQPERVYTGLQPATSATLVSDISIGEAFVRGRKMRVDRAESHTYTASKDTYVDVCNSITADGGIFRYTEVANGAAEPSVASNCIRLAKAVTNGTGITGVTDLRNLYCAGHKVATGTVNLTNAFQDITGATATFEVSQACRALVKWSIDFDPTAGTGTMTAGDLCEGEVNLDTVSQTPEAVYQCAVNNQGRLTMACQSLLTLSSGAHTMKLRARNANGSRGQIKTAGTGMTWQIIVQP